MNRAYVVRLLSIALAGYLSVGVINLVVDPYGFFRWIEIAGFNQQKEGVRSKIRFVKALELPLRRPHTLLMGTSRTHDALNPSSSALVDVAPVYNLGVDMLRIREATAYLRHATENANIKRVILGLDFFMFNAYQRQNYDFDSSLVGRRIWLWDYLAVPIFSLTALSDSLQTVRLSRRWPERSEFLSNGYRPQAFYGLRSNEKSHYYTNWVFLTPRPQNTLYYDRISLDAEVFSDFESLVRLCAVKGIDLHLFISPAHSGLDGEGIRIARRWEMLEDWKRQLATIASRYHVPLWDFSGYNSVTTEPVNTPMRYYTDSSHFTELVGDWILSRILRDGGGAPPDFGVRLTPDSIDAHLEHVRRDRERFVRDNPEVAQQLQEDYRVIIEGGPLDSVRIEGMF